MNKKLPITKILLFLIILILVFSIAFLSSLSASDSMKKYGYTYYYLWHQIQSGFLPGLLLGIAAFLIPLKTIKKWAPKLVFLNILILFAVFIPGIGARAGGANRWIDLGFINFQPSEFLKITAILYISAWIASKILHDKAPEDWKSNEKKGYHKIIYVFAPFIVFLSLIVIGLILQKDLSTLGIIVVTLCVLYFSSKTPLWHSAFLFLVGIAGALIFIISEPYRISRVMTLLNPTANPLGSGLQITQSLMALGSGGVFGKGLGMSSVKFFLPEARTDSIFAVMGEELGLVGCAIIILIFIALFWLGIKIIKNSNNTFGQILTIGIVFYLSLQAFINMASAAGIFPLTGIPLPFFSYGGSHLAVELMALGLLLNVSKNTTN